MESVLLHKKEGVAVITLHRSKKLNSFNREMALRLQSILQKCATDKSVRAIYLTGHGKGFCAGQDLEECYGEHALDFETILFEHYTPIITQIRTMEKPVICAVNGVAAGAGANIALCCDIVVAAQSANFIQAFSKIGLVPDSGGTFILPRLIGFQKASAYMMLGDRISAYEAQRIGMIYKVFSDEDFAEKSMEIALRLSKMPTKAMAYIKKALNESCHNSLEEQLRIEAKMQIAASLTQDYKEGVKAFLEKREPVFIGE